MSASMPPIFPSCRASAAPYPRMGTKQRIPMPIAAVTTSDHQNRRERQKRQHKSCRGGRRVLYCRLYRRIVSVNLHQFIPGHKGRYDGGYSRGLDSSADRPNSGYPDKRSHH
ncbi:MAG: hypothetical protein K6A68_14590 [Clostridiales bacterium]|nr:hypothetical protein [Clostridiales bacterium]